MYWLILALLIVIYFINFTYQRYQDYREHPIRKFPNNLTEKDWQKVDVEIKKYFPRRRFSKQPADLALIDLEKWLNFRLGKIIRQIPPKKRNFKQEWQKKITDTVQKALKKRDYFRFENCSLETLKSYLSELHNRPGNKTGYKPSQEVSENNQFELKYQYDQSPITVDEFARAMDVHNNRPDKYYITYNILRKLPSIHKEILEIMDKLTLQDEFSSEWKDGILFLEHKANKDVGDPRNYRPLIKMPLVTRIYHRIITNRIYNYLTRNKILNINVQKGFFRNFCGCQENILIVKELIKDTERKNQPLSLLFLDIENAYGSLKRSVIEYCLEEYKFPESIKKYIRGFYHQNKGIISVGGLNYDKFDWNVGVYQGDSLANILFITSINIILNHIYNKYQDKGYMFRGVNTSVLAFVDDILLVANYRNDLLKIYQETSELLADMGFKLKLNKLRLLELKQDNLPPLMIEGQEVKKLSDTFEFKHLGSYFSQNQNTSDLVQQYCLDLEEIFQKIDKLEMNRKEIKNYQKYCIYKTNILPKIRWFLLAETWDFEVIRQIEDVEIKYLRKWGKKDDDIISILNHTRKIMKDSQYKLFTNSIDRRIMDLSMEYFNTNSQQKQMEKNPNFENPLEVQFLNIDDTDYRAAIS